MAEIDKPCEYFVRLLREIKLGTELKELRDKLNEDEKVKFKQKVYTIGEKEWVLIKVYWGVSEKHISPLQSSPFPIHYELTHIRQDERPPTYTIHQTGGLLEELINELNEVELMKYK